jgi:hypothetical protein
MIKIRVHIESGEVYMDDRVYKEIMLPSLPYIGSFLGIDSTTLHEKAESSLDIAKDYREWFYGHTSIKISDDEDYEITLDDIKNLSFDDASVVKSIHFWEDEDYVSIEIGI